MQTIALRFADNFAPSEGTIAAHENLLKEKGYVWYGKMGNALSSKTIGTLLKTKPVKVLLIHSKTQKRYWVHTDDISRIYPGDGEYPEYYRDKKDKIKTWLRIVKIETAPNDIMSKCTVISSGESLSSVSRHSMSPYFIINVEE